MKRRALRNGAGGVVLVTLMAAVALLAVSCGGQEPAAPPAAPPPAQQTPAPSAPPATTPAPAQAATAAVSIEGFSFKPVDLTVKAGTAVTWTNLDSASHIITERSGEFGSPRLERNGTFTFTFSEKGVFNYICDYHPGMTGKVTVE